LAEPAGYPIDPSMHADLVVGDVGARRIEPGAGATIREVSERFQPSDDAIAANSSGWNCRVHFEYEAAPAVDWYVAPGTPVRATHDGLATLYLNTVVNAFDHYAVPREPYIGNPDRARAPSSPFPGPGGGMGLFVSVANDAFRTEYGHFDLSRTIAALPDDAFVGGYSTTFDYAGNFSTPKPLSQPTIIARWTVHRGDVIGYTGDSGYSEAPHLHYQITRLSDGAKLCPTTESGFGDNGWLTH
jgi:hypothetical protein